jgi:serine/threonine-protein kinase
MADVFLAVSRGPMGFNKLVVIKRLRSALAEETAFRNMFLDEARLAARLNHPNIVHTYEVGEQHGNYFIAMEYLEGQSLNKVMKESIKQADILDPMSSARIIADALAGLHHAHTLRDYDGRPLSIVHRDVSPHNIFVTYDGHVKLVDFGIAKAALSSTETEVGVLKGKVAYMSPEQAMGGPIDHRADIFAMGIVLWEMLTRERLMTGESAANTLHRLMNVPIRRPTAIVPSIPPPLDDIVMRALEKDPSRRFQTAAEMRDALERWMASTGAIVRQEDVGRRVSTLFYATREEVQRQIQKHMAVIGGAASTQELHALTLESLKRMDRAGANVSGHLLRLGGSGSGSGVISNYPPATTTARSARTGTLVPLVLAAFFGVAFVIVLVFAFRKELVAKQPAQATASTVQPVTTDPAKQDPVATTVTTASPPPTQTGPVPGPVTTTPTPTVQVTAQPTRTARTPTTPTGARSAATASTTKPPPTAPGPSDDPGFLSLDTYPYSKCTVAGKTLGTPIVKLPLSPGAHTVTCETPETGKKGSWTVNIKSGEVTAKRYSLE